MGRFRTGILGATGLVGQTLLARLAEHPWFEPVAVAASERSVGRPYGEAARWLLTRRLPPRFAAFTVRRCRPEEMGECDLVFSALDGRTAAAVEPAFVDAGIPVVSNSSAHRAAPEVPLVIPEVNASHLGILDRGPSSADPGFVVTNPNCSVSGLALALAPLDRAFGVRRVVVSTMQALSGAGAEGPRAIEMLDNVIPYIPGEEEKMEFELRKLFGSVAATGIAPRRLAVSAHCHRVGTTDGHLEAVSVEMERSVSPEDAGRALREFRGDVAGLDLPSAPAKPVVVRDEPDRPQPRLDRDESGGMSVVVGRLRPCPIFTLRLEILSHNTVRGAAGGAILNAELLAATGRLAPRTTR